MVNLELNHFGHYTMSPFPSVPDPEVSTKTTTWEEETEIKFTFSSPQNFCFMYATAAPTTFILDTTFGMPDQAN